MAITNGRGSLAELNGLAGGERRGSTFSSENGAAVRHRHFGRVERHDVDVRTVFADRATAAAHLETLERGDLAARLPADMGRLVARGPVTVFAADTRA